MEMEEEVERWGAGPPGTLKGELRHAISLLHMKVLTLIKAKTNVFL